VVYGLGCCYELGGVVDFEGGWDLSGEESFFCAVERWREVGK
jgi:hypothetical protein